MSNILRNETRHIMRQGAFLPDTDVKSLEPPLATLIMAEKRQVICQTTALPMNIWVSSTTTR